MPAEHDERDVARAPDDGAAPAADGTPDPTSVPEVVDREPAETAGDGGAHDADPDLEAAAEAVEVDLEALLAEREQFLDAYRRVQADFENYRKQALRRQDDAVQRALAGFAERLLPVLDACDAAVAHGAGEVEPVVNALVQALEKEGLQRVEPHGEPFDPELSEAVVHEPGTGGPQVVAEVLRAGYVWNGRVLRPAMVKVTD